MAKDDHKKIDAILALPLNKKGKDEDDEPPPESEPEEDDDEEDDGKAEDEALSALFEAAKGDDEDAFKEAFRKAVEICVG